MITTIIYDLDGTLVEFKLDLIGMKEVMLDLLLKQQVPRRYLRLEDPTSVMFANSWKYLKGLGWSEDSFRALENSIMKTIEPYELEAANATNLHQGVESVLRHFRIEKKSQVVFTNVTTEIAHVTLNRFNLTGYFEDIIGRDQVPALKPDPRGLGRILRKLKRTADEVIFVGDSSIDMVVARDNKVLGIGVTTGFSNATELTDNGAYAVIEKISDLPDLVTQLQRK